MQFAPKEWWQTTKDFIAETKAEMKKVTWPQRHEVVGTTGVVLGAVVLFGVYLAACDQLFYRVVDLIFEKVAGV